MRNLQDEYGDRGKSVFYALAKKRKAEPAFEKPKRNYQISKS